MQELINQLAHDGFFVRDVIPDGKIHRFELDRKDSKKSGYYICYRNFSPRTGEEFFVITYGSWRENEPRTFCTLKGKLNAEEKKIIKKKIDESKKNESKERERIQIEAAKECDRIWNGLSESGESVYLERKKISIGCGLSIRFDGEGSFYVPVRDIGGKLTSLQKIQGDGGKYFFPGGKVQSGFHTLGEVVDGSIIYLVEGFATASSVFLATSKPTVCAFNSSNLGSVATALRGKYPKSSIVVCGDDDQWSTRADGTPYNAGRERGEDAARKVAGTVIFPTFKDLSTKPTDFNDLHVLEGLDEVLSQLVQVKEPDRQFIVALGFKDKDYFFTSSQNRQVVGVSKFSEADLLGLMPIEYWESVYPGAGTARVDWTEARSSLMSQARERGIFQSRNVRGTGVWSDDGRVIVNMGDHLNIDGVRHELGSVESRFFYTLGHALPPIHERPLTLDECETLVNACDLIRWKNPDFGFLMAGALVLSRICGALPIRPHVWITAPMGEGKTTIHNRLMHPIMGEFAQTVTGSTTEAYVRQVMENSAAPLMFDEFETTDTKSSERIQSLLTLMRSSWDNSGSGVGRGGASGSPVIYYPRFSAFVFSIRTNLIQDADKSRFAVLELAPHKSDPAHWKKLDSLLDKIDMEYGERLFSRTVRMVPVIKESFKRLKFAFDGKVSSRFKDQYGMLLAGYSALLSDTPIDDETARRLVEHVGLADEKEESKNTDQQSALSLMLGKKISIEVGDGRNSIKKDFSIGEAIDCILFSSGPMFDVQKGLQRIGIRVESEFVAIAANGHPELEGLIYRGTRWSQNWCNSLLRLPGARKGDRMKIASVSTRPVLLPAEIFKSQ